MAATSPSRVPTETGCASERRLTLREAAELGYGSVSTLRRYIADGRLPAVKVGSRVKVLESDLRALAVPVKSPSFESVEAAARRIAAAAPPLTPEQRRVLRGVFGGAS